MADLTGPNPDEVNGLDARGAAITAKPVLVGSRGSGTVPAAVTAGQSVDLWSGLSGNLFVTLTDPAGTIPAAMGAPGDAEANAQNMGQEQAFLALFNGTTWDRVRSGGVTGMQGVSGDTAHDAVDAGNPLKIGGYAKATAPTAVSTAGDRVNAWFGMNGQQAVTLVDFSGTALSTGTQYAEDTALGTTPTGTLLMARRQDSLSALTPVNDDAFSLRGNSVGSLWVAVDGGNVGAGSGDGGNPLKIGGYAKNAAPTAVTDGQRANAWFGLNGQLNVTLRDASGAYVSPAGGTVYTEDAALGAVGTGVGSLSIARASAAAPTSVSADADAVGLWASRFGALHVILTDTAGAMASAYSAPADGESAAQVMPDSTGYLMGYNGSTWDRVRVANTGRLQVDTQWVASSTDEAAWTAGASTLTGIGGVFNDSAAALTSGQQGTVRLTADRGLVVEGNVAHDGVDAGYPVKIGGRAQGSTPTAVSDGDRVNAWFGVQGALVVAASGSNLTPGDALNNANAEATFMAANGTVGRLGVLNRVYNGASWDMARSVGGIGDAAGTGIQTVGPTVFNGATWDRVRSVTAAATATADTGILAVGVGPGYARLMAQTVLNANAQTAVINVKGAGTVFFDITATTPSLTGTWEVTTDDSTWWAYSMLNLATGAWDATITAAGRWSSGEMARFRQVRLRISAYTSGSFTVNAHAEPMSRYVAIEGDNAAGVADQGNPVKIGGYASAAAPTAVTAGQRANAWLDLIGRQVVVAKSSTGTESNVASSASDVTILAANTSRTGATITNDSTSVLYLLLSNTTSSATVFTAKIAASSSGNLAYYEVPFGYTGVIKGIWASANGFARVTEFV